MMITVNTYYLLNTILGDYDDFWYQLPRVWPNFTDSEDSPKQDYPCLRHQQNFRDPQIATEILRSQTIWPNSGISTTPSGLIIC